MSDPNIDMAQWGTSTEYTRGSAPFYGIKDGHSNEYWCALMGFDNETGYGVDYNQIHRDRDNRFVGIGWFEDQVEVTCQPTRSPSMTRNANLQDVQFQLKVDEGAQWDTTFRDYIPNETNADDLDANYDVSIGAAIGWGPLSAGISVSDSSEEMDYTPYQHLLYDTDPGWGGGLPERDNEVVGFETDIVSDRPAGETVNFRMYSSADYTIWCEGPVYFSTPEAQFGISLEVVD